MRSLSTALLVAALTSIAGCAAAETDDANADTGAAVTEGAGTDAPALTLGEDDAGGTFLVVKETAYTVELKTEAGREWRFVVRDDNVDFGTRPRAPQITRRGENQLFRWTARLIVGRPAQKHVFEYRDLAGGAVLKRLEIDVLVIGAGRGSPACPSIRRPVCGSDGLWYDNTCEAANGGVSVPGGGCTTADFRCPPVATIDCDRLGTTGYCRDDYRAWAKETCATRFR